MSVTIDKPALDQLQKYMAYDHEVGGNFLSEQNGQTWKLTIADPIFMGDRYQVNFDQMKSPFNFHTHPLEDTILYSFYSPGDVTMNIQRQMNSDKIRKDFLVTEDGLFSFQLSGQIMKLVKVYTDQIIYILWMYQQYIMEQKMNPLGYQQVLKEFDTKDWFPLKKKYICTIPEMVSLMNDLNGFKLIDWALGEIDKNELSLLDQHRLRRGIGLGLETIKNIYYIEFMPWCKDTFSSEFKK